MPQDILDKIEESLQQAENSYHRLVLLVGKSGAGKTAVLQSIADKLGKKVINVNLVTTEALLEVAQNQRSSQLPDLLDDILSPIESPLILDNLEILFDKTLKLDPLSLLKKFSRNRTILASWSGTFEHGNLTYADPNHPEYRPYDQVDALIVPMGSQSAETPVKTA